MSVTYVVPLWNPDTGVEALASILAQNPSPAAVLAFLNGIEAPALEERFPTVRFLRLPQNTGFSGACALGLHESATEFTALVNDDCVLPPGWARALLEAMAADPACAAAAGVAVRPDGSVQTAGVEFDPKFEAQERTEPPADPLLNFTAVLLRTEPVRRAGGLEPRYFAYYEDVDLCLRLKAAGSRTKVEPGVRVTHFGSRSAAKLGARRAHLLMRNRHWTLLRNFGFRLYLRHPWRVLRADWPFIRTSPLLAFRVYPFLPLFPRARR
jgi:GT2 family glycosyltransferase